MTLRLSTTLANGVAECAKASAAIFLARRSSWPKVRSPLRSSRRASVLHHQAGGHVHAGERCLVTSVSSVHAVQ